MPFDRTCTHDSIVDVQGLVEEDILAALYNAGVKFGVSAADPTPNIIDDVGALAILLEHATSRFYIDWAGGKRFVIDFGDVKKHGKIETGQYNFYYGPNHARRAIEILRETGDPTHPDIIALQTVAELTVAIRTRRTVPAGTVTQGTFADDLPDLRCHDPEHPEWDDSYNMLESIICTDFHL